MADAIAPDQTGAAALAVLLSLSWFATPSLAAAPQRVPAIVEYWTIAANEGESAGGHAALRLDDVVHHLEHRGDGLLQDRRDERAAFEAAYRGRDNREIRVLRLDLPPERAGALDTVLRERALSRRLRLDALESVEEEIRWLERSIDQGSATLVVPGLGLFVDGPTRCRSDAIVGVPDRASQSLATARHRARRERERALADAMRAGPGGGSAFRRLLEATQLEVALDAVASCRPLRPSALARPPRLEPLSLDERRAWLEIEAHLEHALVRLIESERPDRGLALFLAWSRLQASRHTLVSDRWTLLDGFAEAEGPPVRLDPMPAGPRAERRRRLEIRSARARADLGRAARAGTLEPWLDRLERLAHDAAHANEGTRHGAPGPRGALETSRALERPSASVALPWPPEATLDSLRRRRLQRMEDRARLRDALNVDLGYDLIARNCVTELLDALREADIEVPRAHGLAAFAPAFARAELEKAPVARPRATRPSARHATIESALVTLPHATQRIALRARESNTLTSRFYRPHRRDSTFLFFAEGPVVTRPLAGVSNLVWGSGASLLGALTAPFDRGTLLRRGLKGMALSLPEIAFVPIRKGSYVVALPLEDPD